MATLKSDAGSGQEIITVCDGKYSFVLAEGTDGLRDILRYGEPWMQESSGYEVKYNRAIGALAAELADMLKKEKIS